MKYGSTLFLKAVICLIGLAVLALCVILLGVSLSGNAGMYLPILLGMCVTAVPFFFALFQGLLLLNYIDKGTAFSEQSVTAIRNIKLSAGGISICYALAMPYIAYIADKDDAPGAIVIALVFMFAPLVTAVFAAVLQMLLQNAIDLKSENDLTV